ncbi:DUF3553 domain-containing protein [Paracoccus sp. p4-l81]|uniref:DUF3553 domain-containing protein n=1 Tax=unclassified Paracoccus (in: a-proteobacteria) TaxID=2688777 RepID=UPI0035B762DA
MNELLEPGMWVRHPQAPDWGRGQVQSRVGSRVTVTFEHAGKRVIDGTRVELDWLNEPPV